MTTHSSIIPGKFHEQKSLAVHGVAKSQTQLRIHTYTHPQYSCLKSSMDRGGGLQSKGEAEHAGTHIPQAECEPSQKCPRAWGSSWNVRGALT